MRILFITSYPLEYNSSANIRNLGLISGLIKLGHKVSTLSSFPSNSAYFKDFVTMPFEKRFWLGGEKSLNGPTNQGRPSRFKKFFAKIYSWFSIYDRRKGLVKYITKDLVTEDFDIVLSSTDPKSAHILAEALINIRPSVCKKWIQYWGDPFSGDIMSKSVITKTLALSEERRLISLSDKAIFVSPFTAEDIKLKHPMYSAKIIFEPIPYYEDSFNNNEVQINNGYISYLGNYTLATRDIRPFVQAIEELGLPAAIVGDSDLKLKGSKNLLIQDRMSREELKGVMDNTSIYVCVCNTHGTQIPGKIYHYVGSAKPILIILDGEYSKQMKEYFEQFNRFYICNNNVDDIKNAILQIKKENKQFAVPEILKDTVIANKILNYII